MPTKKTPTNNPVVNAAPAQAQGPLRRSIHFLLHSMLGFILAFEIRVLYNIYGQPQVGGFKYGEEPWPSTQLGFMALVPLAAALQWGVNLGLAELGW